MAICPGSVKQNAFRKFHDDLRFKDDQFLGRFTESNFVSPSYLPTRHFSLASHKCMLTQSNLLLGVLSDTHGHVQNTQAAARMLDSLGVDEVLHCGDIGSEAIPRILEKWPTHYVFGNVDREEDELRDAIERSAHTCHGRFGEIEFSGKRIALVHSDDAALFQKTIGGGDFDLVCYGHTHKAEQHRVGSTLVLNPGAVYRAAPHSLALVEFPTMRVTIVPF